MLARSCFRLCPRGPSTQLANNGRSRTARAKVRENFKYGADLIKVGASGGVLSKGDAVGATQYTVEEMEAALGIPEGNLVEALDRYNKHAADGADPDFHKQPEYVAPQTKSPWAAFDLSLGRAMYSGFTMGGLAVTVDGQVLTGSGGVIPGLYAAGACASNIAQDGKGYSSGTQLGEGSFFGRRAGKHAAGS